MIEIGDGMFEDEEADGEYDDESEAYEPAEEASDEESGKLTEEYYEDEPAQEPPLSEELTGNEVLAASDEEEDYMDELIRSKKLENQPAQTQKRDRDERAMIREQERLAQEKKRKKRNKRRNIIIGTVAAVLAVGIWFIGWGYSLIFGTNTEASTVEIVVESGQEVVYAKLTSVKGNEITYTVAEAVETTEDTENEQTGGELPSDATDGETLPDRDTSSDATDGEMPTDMTDGAAPSGFSDGDNTQEGFGVGESTTDSYTVTSLGMGGMGSDMGGNMRGGGSFDMDSFDFSSFLDSSSGTASSTDSDTFTYDGVTYQLTDESDTMQIPVGTDVTTRLGTVTTFSRLAAGDCVALVMQEVDGEDVIMSVYIIG